MTFSHFLLSKLSLPYLSTDPSSFSAKFPYLLFLSQSGDGERGVKRKRQDEDEVLDGFGEFGPEDPSEDESEHEKDYDNDDADHQLNKVCY